MLAVRKALEWVEQGRIPDIVVRKGIRTLLGQRLAELQAGGAAGAAERSEQFMAAMGQAPIALLPGLANEQHYELPAEFFAAVLGPHRKYSCCFFAGGQETLEQAEVAALRAELATLRTDLGALRSDLGA